MASINAHALLGRGINARAEQAAQPHIDLLDASSDLAAAVESHHLLFKPHFGIEAGTLLYVDADTRRGLVRVQLLKIDSTGSIERELARIDLTREETEAAAEKVAALQPDGDGYIWATDAFIACGGAA